MAGVVGKAIKGFGKALKVSGRNKASKSLFNNPPYSPKLQHPVITSVKPSVGKTKHQKNIFEIKKSGKKSVGKIKKDFTKNMAPLEEANTKLRRTTQKIKGEPVTKSGFSKGKDLK